MDTEKEIKLLAEQNAKLQKEFELLQGRIKATEADRTHERGFPRTLLICVAIYGVALLYVWIINATNSIFVSAGLPVIGFFVSSLIIHFFRIQHHRRTVKQQKLCDKKPELCEGETKE